MAISNHTRSDIHYVGFWARFAAFILDNIALMLILPFLFSNSVSFDLLEMGDPNQSIDLGTLVGDPSQSMEKLMAILYQSATQVLVLALIFLLFWKIFAATPGKMLFKSYIVNADDLKTASNTQLLIRYFSYFLSLFGFGIGFLWIAFDDRKQGWHDKLAKTVVVYQKPLDQISDEP